MIQFHADIDLIIAEAGDDNRPARIAGIAVPWDVVATVSGGQNNIANGAHAAIGGGNNNSATNQGSTCEK